MEYIQRKKSSLDKLKKTNDDFNLLIRGMTGGRCSFCTKRITDFNSEMTVEHIQTKVSTPSKIFE